MCARDGTGRGRRAGTDEDRLLGARATPTLFASKRALFGEHVGSSAVRGASRLRRRPERPGVGGHQLVSAIVHNARPVVRLVAIMQANADRFGRTSVVR